MDSVNDAGPWIRALRTSHDRLAAIVAPLNSDGLRENSYASEWSIAQVLSHLGSGAEIFLLNLDSGLTGGDPPAQTDYQAIWDVWNARSPEEQATESVAANEALVSRVEGLSDSERAAFRVAMFGMTMDLAGHHDRPGAVVHARHRRGHADAGRRRLGGRFVRLA